VPNLQIVRMQPKFFIFIDILPYYRAGGGAHSR
jgi:hypothetical protein